MSTPLHDRIALVTGAAGGIGQAICRALAAEGATVALHYHTQKETAYALAAELGGAAFAADITEAAVAQSLVERVVGELGGLDILVNNAGITIGGQFVADMKLADWHRVLDVNLNSVLYMCKAALPLMRVRGGAVVNIASNVVNTLPGGAAAYATTKAGVVALTKVLSKEEAEHGIRVNVVSPG
ncbi:MAG: SDR family NAD(P)-dependent oxidoreductase, partial [Gemmatimonadota bacterium]|nr:SDR family NAD(P)-dependent oxidoreductase [Gemmatimonadota bacterium]